MQHNRYSVGVDFGTESCRALIVDIETGQEMASAVAAYQNGVIDKLLGASKVQLQPETALQDPNDYLGCLRDCIVGAVSVSGIVAQDIVSIGIAFTSCTVLPTLADSTPLAGLAEWKDHPHAWPKLWKHHSAQSEADEITEQAIACNESWLEKYGGKVSAEWLHSKALEILHDDPEVFCAADYIIEAGDWIVWQLTGKHQRSACNAGYKALWNEESGYPSNAFLKMLHPEFVALTPKLDAPTFAPGEFAGALTDSAAELTGLIPGTAVAIGTIDAHAAAAGSGAANSGELVMVLGTSSCHMLLGNDQVLVPGISGVVRDGIVPGFFGYEAGQAGVGDSFDWLARLLETSDGASSFKPLSDEALKSRSRLLERLEIEVEQIPAGASGLLTLDWWNGNRSTLNDSDLSGLIIGLTTSTTAAELYRAMMEATGFGLRTIIEQFQRSGVQVTSLIASGGIARKNKALMQIYADIMQMPITVAASKYCSALGAAMLGANALRISEGGRSDLPSIVRRMAQQPVTVYHPNEANSEIYNELFSEYSELYKMFGTRNSVMKRLRELRYRGSEYVTINE